ncbi:chemotaxis protein CheW [Roseibacterium sp. SDUM158017]|uniref:chemotaxis protein CheW n=1 Tax=Roseicyclus salinarum TaxID=3036773 RepID=UPI002414E00D|nr:chemotaxis protein CheW [Roseibacterium sp. SDUM158017]MDG4649241.1 chemotaxis protein CheW [Roseibacterium sp. SDUM158017]
MLQNSAQETPGQRDVVSFRLAEQDFCIDIGVVREIRGWTPTTVLPHSQDYMKGVVNLRGSVVAVVDLSARLGFGPTEPSARHIIIIVMIGDQTIGLLADVVSDILTIDDTIMRQVPDVASEVARDFISSVVTFDDGRMLRKIDLARVLPELGAELA